MSAATRSTDAADRAWQRRAVRADGAEGTADTVRADPQAVETAVAGYRELVVWDPEDPGARARLLRALVFQGRYLIEGEDAQRDHFDEARLLAEEGFERLAHRLGGTRALEDLEPEKRAAKLRQLGAETGWSARDLAALHFWGAVAWGHWADRVGSFTAAREGVAGKLRTLAGTALELDETYSDAGPHRFLGRLHSEAPKIPLITGWVDRGQAVHHLERAVELAPDEPENALFLAEALLEHRPRRSDEARELLRDLTERRPRPDHLLEDSATLARVEELLTAER